MSTYLPTYTQQVPRDTLQWHEFRYLFNNLHNANRYSMAIGLTAFFALMFFNGLRKSLKPR